MGALDMALEATTDVTLSEVNGTEAIPTPEPLAYSRHVIIGIYILFVGVTGTLSNGLVVTMFFHIRSLATPTNLLLINLAVADLGISTLGGALFSGPSSIAGRWLFGSFGCQFYAFMGFLFGSANIGTLALIALDRYAVTCRCEIRGRLTYGRYCHLIGLVWLSSAFWALMPLLGWARYNFEPSLTTCTIDWRHNTGGYRSFLLVYFVLWYLVPLGIIFFCYWHAARSIRRGRSSPRDHYCYDWANESNVTLMCFLLVVSLQMCFLLVVSFAVCWSGYAVVCLWTVFLPPETVPFILTLLPPLMAKTYPVINPMIFFVCNTRIRTGMQITLKRIFCQDLTDEAVIEEPAANTTHPECAAIVAQDGGTILCRKCSYCRRQDCKTIVY